MEKNENSHVEIWALGGGKGGTGKTFVLSQLANCLASKGKRVILIDTDFGGANLKQSVLHCINDQGTNWSGANLKLVDRTDPDLAEAEDWKPPPPQNI